MRLLSRVVCAMVVCFGLGVSAAHAAGLPMISDMETRDEANDVLAQRIEKALQRDPDGNAVIAGSECTTPRDFYRAIREYHSGADLGNVRELPAYIRGLQLRDAPDGEFTMSRMLHEVSGEDATCTLDLSGWRRDFRNSEGSWYDPNTGEPVLAGDCSNVVKPRSYHANSPCGGVRHLLVNVWQFSELPDWLQEDVRSLAEREATRETFRGKSVSRTLGRKIRVQLASTARVSFPVSVSHIATANGDTKIAHEESLDTIQLSSGYGTTTVPEVVTQSGHAVRITLPYRPADSYTVISPSVFGMTGTRELRLFGDEWNSCSINVHIILKKRKEEQ